MDAAARRRGASAYGPEGAIPMFPEAFAFKRGPVSLALGKTRCAMSVTAVLDDSGEAEEFWIGPTTIRVTHAVTETEAARMLDEHESKKDGGEHAGLASLLEAATRRASLRERRGAVTLELPESACVVRRSDSAANEPSPEEGDEDDDDDEDDAAEEDDENDLVERDAHVLASGGRNAGERAAAAARRHEAARLDVSLRVAAKAPRAHVVVSEMMILAGELVGRFGAANDLPLPYRGQGDPVSVDVSGAPEGVPRAVLKRGGMRGASVGATPRRHGGLGVEAYVQFTSPIRRYLDVLAHAQIKAFLRTEKNGSSTKALSGRVPFPDAAALEPVLQTVNERTRDAKSATRDATAFWQTFWFATRGRDVEHDAIVAKWIRRDQRLAAVFLSATGVERSVKLDAVEKALGTRVSLGDLVVLRVRDADPFENRLAFDATRVVKK
jgi:exoribonuclease-2